MYTDQEIIKKLHTLQSVVPSNKLRERLAFLGKHLPDSTPARAPFGLFRPAIILGILFLLLGGMGSGVILSANQSKPGSFLFPVKKAVIQTQIHFTASPIEKQKLEEEILLITPTATPTPTPTVVPTQKPEKKEEEPEKKDVKGAQIQIVVTITPTPQERSENHGSSWHRFIPSQTIQKFFNKEEDDNKGSSIFLTNHEF